MLLPPTVEHLLLPKDWRSPRRFPRPLPPPQLDSAPLLARVALCEARGPDVQTVSVCTCCFRPQLSTCSCPRTGEALADFQRRGTIGAARLRLRMAESTTESTAVPSPTAVLPPLPPAAPAPPSPRDVRAPRYISHLSFPLLGRFPSQRRGAARQVKNNRLWQPSFARCIPQQRFHPLLHGAP
jgi:hypothetical protein